MKKFNFLLVFVIIFSGCSMIPVEESSNNAEILTNEELDELDDFLINGDENGIEFEELLMDDEKWYENSQDNDSMFFDDEEDFGSDYVDVELM